MEIMNGDSDEVLLYFRLLLAIVQGNFSFLTSAVFMLLINISQCVNIAISVSYLRLKWMSR